MSKLFLSLALFVAPAAFASSPSLSPGDSITAELREVSSEDINARILVDTDCSITPMAAPETDDDGFDWSQIIAIGEKIWKVVEANKPVVTVKTPTVSALPRGVRCWSDLDSWKAAKVKSFEVAYKNGFGMEVVKFRFRLQYTYGGGHNGTGKYLANVTVLPAELNVMWGYTFNANVEVNPAVNVGSSTNPVAGLDINLKWNVETVLMNTQSSFHFFVQGDGVAQADN